MKIHQFSEISENFRVKSVSNSFGQDFNGFYHNFRSISHSQLIIAVSDGFGGNNEEKTIKTEKILNFSFV